MFFFLRLVFLTCILCAPSLSRAQEVSLLFGDFNPGKLVKSEKRFLQTALAFEGRYVGLLDGAWGGLSREAMHRYSHSEFGSASENWHMVMLAYSLFERTKRDGWQFNYIEAAGISLLWPFKSIVADPPVGKFADFRHTRSSLGMSIAIQSGREALRTHDFVRGRHVGIDPVYALSKKHLAISSSELPGGGSLYARSNFVRGAWTTVLLSSNAEDNALLTAVAASITVGRTHDLKVVRGGELAKALEKAEALLAQVENEAPSDEAVADVGTRRLGSGSGFYVSKIGKVLTNAHVVEGCASVFADEQVAHVIAVSEDWDLALLNVPEAMPHDVAIFAAQSAKLNADVTVVGFPYGGILGGLNVTRGAVSSLKGLDGDATRMQISAPIQKGNSGGPVLSADGDVVGVVVSKLNAAKAAEIMGDIPQNVNFAVRGEIAKLFLSQNGVDVEVSLSDPALSPELLAKLAGDYTILVECK